MYKKGKHLGSTDSTELRLISHIYIHIPAN